MDGQSARDYAVDSFFSSPLTETDPDLAAAIGRELGRQRDEIELIASENIVSQAVLDADAVMGQVVQVTPFSSTVLLITDPSHSTPVQVLRSGLRTIAVGSTASMGVLPTARRSRVSV